MKSGITKRELYDLDKKAQRIMHSNSIPKGAKVEVESEIYHKFNTECLLVHYNDHSYYVDKNDIETLTS